MYLSRVGRQPRKGVGGPWPNRRGGAERQRSSGLAAASLPFLPLPLLTRPLFLLQTTTRMSPLQWLAAVLYSLWGLALSFVALAVPKTLKRAPPVRVKMKKMRQQQQQQQQQKSSRTDNSKDALRSAQTASALMQRPSPSTSVLQTARRLSSDSQITLVDDGHLSSSSEEKAQSDTSSSSSSPPPKSSPATATQPKDVTAPPPAPKRSLSGGKRLKCPTTTTGIKRILPKKRHSSDGPAAALPKVPVVATAPGQARRNRTPWPTPHWPEDEHEHGCVALI